MKTILTLLLVVAAVYAGSRYFKNDVFQFIKNQGQVNQTNSDIPPEPTIDQRNINGEFIRELYKVVLVKELKDENVFIRYMNVLDQGGHYEGVYNGIVYSYVYKNLEQGTTPVGALKAFSKILNLLTSQSEETIESQYLRTSLYTLKRVLAEEVLKTIDTQSEYREKLATWYSKFTVELNKFGIDFGIDKRNQIDETYHYKWALTADTDRLKWECLNRVHRILNAKGELVLK